MPENQKPNRSWAKLSCIGCFLLPIIFLLVTVGWFKYQVAKKGDQLPVELAKLKKMGLPTEPADLAPKPPIADAQNAAALYRQLLSDMKSMPGARDVVKAVVSIGSAQSTPESDAAGLQALAKMSPFLDKADKLADYPYLDFKRNYAQGPYLMFDEYSGIKDIVKLQAARVRLYAQKGDYQGSLKTLRAMFVAARHCAQEPTIISSLVGSALDAIACAALEKHLEAFKGNQPALAATRKLLESTSETIDLKRPLEGELVMGRISVQSIKGWKDVQMFASATDENGTPDNSWNPLDKLSFEDPAVRRMFEAKFVQQWRIAFEKMPAENSDWQGLRKVMTDVETSVAKDNSTENKLNKILFPVFAQYARTGGLYQMRHRLYLLATRLLQDRPKGLPKSLSGYGNLAIDPMDGKPMRYDLKGGGFKIWSVGRNEKDDGGVKFYPGVGMEIEDTDEVLHFFYPEKAPPPGKRKPAPAPGFGGPPRRGSP